MKKEVIEAARLGGEQVRKYFGKTTKTFNKTTLADFRTEADLASEKVILKKLKKHFPDYNYIAEESGNVKNGSDYTFVIDPLDGTNNFSIGISNFSVSIGLQKGDETILGIVYNPILDDMYYAEQGKGAFINNSKITTNDIDIIQDATLAYVGSYNGDITDHNEAVKALHTAKIKRYLNNWSPALDCCLLASGKIESMICNGNEIYDSIAGKIIIKEAGGVITRFDGSAEKGEADTYFVASNNKKLHKQIVKVITNIDGHFD